MQKDNRNNYRVPMPARVARPTSSAVERYQRLLERMPAAAVPQARAVRGGIPLPSGDGDTRKIAMRGGLDVRYDPDGNLVKGQDPGGGNPRNPGQASNDPNAKTRRSGVTVHSPRVVANAELAAKLTFARKQAEIDFKNHKLYDKKYLKLDAKNITHREKLAEKQGKANLHIYQKLAPREVRLDGRIDRLALKTADRTNDLATKQSLNQFRRFGETQGKIVRNMQQALDPTAFAAREAAGKAALSDFKLGGDLSRQEEEEWNNRIRARQTASGNVLGAAPITAEAMEKGRIGFERYNQRLDRLLGFGSTMQQPAQAPTIFHAGSPATARGTNTGAMPSSSTGILGTGLPGASSGVRPADMGSAPVPDFNGYASAQAAVQRANAAKPNPWIGAASGALNGAVMGAPYAGSTYGLSSLAGALIGGTIGYASSGGF